MRRVSFAICGLAAFFQMSALLAEEKPAAKSVKEALQQFNELIGPWNAVGEPEGTPQEKQRGFWKEKVSWGWKFKGDDVWLTVSIKDGKHFRGGELRYLADKDEFELKLNPKEGDKPLVFIGSITNKGRSFVAERTDDKTKQTQRVTIDLVGDINFTYLVESKPANRKVFTKHYMVRATREGEALGPTEKRPECVVTGGLGTSTVTYKGVTYYVCCTGCRDAFNENPEKYIKEYNERKKKKE